ncbi:MAG TPA: hypothetical protein PKC72_03700 [Chitinophagaceae bacterium]|nr:hypothetical protein [Chitinophagaceae bacterium]
MMSAAIRLLAIVSFSLFSLVSQAQGDSKEKKEPKPYKVLTSGKQITIKSNKDISHVMLWTSRGNRVIEQREINSGSFSFTIPINDKFFFLMVGMNDGKVYTQKIGTP